MPITRLSDGTLVEIKPPSSVWLSANEAWSMLVAQVYQEGREVRPRDLLCREILAHTTCVDMSRPIATNRPKLGHRYLIAEAWWVISGHNDVASIEHYSPHIASFSNDSIRFDGAYGPRIVDQLRYVCDTLEADWESRQAVVEIWRPNPRPSKDLPCTLTIQWMIRKEGEDYVLHCFDTMRSSDAWLGWPYDVFTFSMLSAYIALMLRDRDNAKQPTGFTGPGGKIKLGRLHLTAASQHLYVDPKQDGAKNIPYSLKDVESFLSSPGFAQEDPYPPLNLDEFSSSGEFLEYLKTCKDRLGSGKEWLAGF